MSEVSKRVSVSLRLDLYERAKVAAAEHYTTIPRLMRHQLCRYLKELEAEEQSREQGKE